MTAKWGYRMPHTFARVRLWALAAVVAVIASIGLTAAPASALNRVGCGNRTDWFTIWNYGWSGQLCFANNGSQNVAIYDVNEVDTGNNSGFYTLAGTTFWQNDWTNVVWSYSSNSGYEITWIDITGR